MGVCEPKALFDIKSVLLTINFTLIRFTKRVSHELSEVCDFVLCESYTDLLMT